MSERAFAVVGLFDSPDALVSAIPVVKARALGRLEAYTPYPVHGVASALGHRRSPLGGMVLVMGILGALVAIVFQWWVSAVDYPTLTGGKALFSWEAFVPIMFEVTVLFATFTAGFGMLVLLARLPFFAHPMLASPAMAGVTRDRLALAIEADEAGALDVAAAEAALAAAGATVTHVVPFPEPAAPTLAHTLGAMFAGIALACVVSGLLTYWAVKLFPVLLPMARMLDQPRVDAQSESSFFADRRSGRLPAPGTIARGALPYSVTSPEEADVLASPLPWTREVLDRGRFVFETYCSVCHGPLGTGAGTLTEAYGAKAADLRAPAVRALTDGRLYDTVMRGKGAMPAYASALFADERWAVVRYVRVLQRAQNAADEDLR